MSFTQVSEVELLLRAKKDSLWIKEHYSKLKEEHDNEFIAVKDSQILDSDSNLENLLSKLSEMRISPSEVLIKFISKTAFVL